jgi:hypothetical protein
MILKFVLTGAAVLISAAGLSAGQAPVLGSDTLPAARSNVAQKQRILLAQSGGESEAYAAAKAADTVKGWQAFLSRYPNGAKSQFAQAYLDLLNRKRKNEPAPSCPTGFSFSNGACVPTSSSSSNAVASDPSKASSWSIIAKKELGVASVLELSGATICIVSGSRGESVQADYFRRHKLEFEKVVLTSKGEVQQAYEAGRCDGLLVQSSQAASTQSILNVPGKHQILPQEMTCESCNRAAR